jgi:hypothetical protein
MFETVIAAMLKHKQIVFAAIAVTALIGYAMPPAVQVAQATSFGGDLASDIIGGVFGTSNDDNGAEEEEDDTDGVDQNLEQDLEQDQEASNEADQSNEQSQTNIQANDLETGDNTATNTANNDADQEVTAVSGDASAAAEAESEADGGCCDDGHHGDKHKKHSSDGHDGSDGSTSSSAEAAAEAISAATATGTQDNDAIATSTQDSSIHDVTFDNEANFAPQNNNPVAIQVNDQDQRAANLAAQLGIDFDATSSFTGTGFTNTD